ncbi:MAG: tRNA pseudouridine(13) synthase TruD [Lysobacterales bacterium CG17_big_fil_post_rev_8_21_14_2_50_64_11]|nr:MAG: tRNA pseudouridine(13) synthase TruD [Xanthomonadales bacterium CG17_big_fil_post_rev_8_21_14_2_50_64_11]PIX60432.1 MAG: tRNA pseudouridine(13) synthase TruD [Xanthomonadales bacterium CG_4_10_14_3_um_filter_64_11]
MTVSKGAIDHCLEWAPPVPLARCHGEAVLDARFRVEAADFQVEELPAFTPSGEGEHLLLEIEKTGMNTAFVAGLLARWAGVAPMAVSYAGMKDRHAVTRQRFSVHLPKRQAPPLDTLPSEGLRVLASDWHARKLQRGALAGNRFMLVLREVNGDRIAIEARLQQMQHDGVANYFGEQRFGHDGGNLDAARALFAGRRFGREQRSILLSAARSALFNAVLHARVQDGTWNIGVDGDVWMLAGSRSVFGPEPLNAALHERLQTHDIHPVGPLWGRGELRQGEPAAAQMRATLAGSEAIRAGLERAGLNLEYRALRLLASNMDWQWLDAATLRLSFALPPGAYATAVLYALGDCRA